jgi:hypothetical protein
MFFCPKTTVSRPISLPPTPASFLYHTVVCGMGTANAFRDEPSTKDGSVQIRPAGPPIYKGPRIDRLHDTQTGMLLGIPRSARCVQRFDDSLNSAIHITFRTFAAFFIDAKAKRSVVESCIVCYSLRRARSDMLR